MQVRVFLVLLLLVMSLLQCVASIGDGGTDTRGRPHSPSDSTDSTDTDASSNVPRTQPGTGGRSSGTGTGNATGDLPCNVQELVVTRCAGCHSESPPGILLDRASFAKPSETDATKSIAAITLERITATDGTRMPPAPQAALTASEVGILQDWIESGMSAGPCGTETDAGAGSTQPDPAEPNPTEPDPTNTPVVCTSNTRWTSGNRGSELMRPGQACITCHTSRDGPSFFVAGTLYPTAHEPNDCNGTKGSTGARIVITDAAGNTQTLTPNDAGNFHSTRAIAMPYTAKVVFQGRERVMQTEQSDGDCNKCHTEAGTQKAPGRIFLP